MMGVEQEESANQEPAVTASLARVSSLTTMRARVAILARV